MNFRTLARNSACYIQLSVLLILFITPAMRCQRNQIVSNVSHWHDRFVERTSKILPTPIPDQTPIWGSNFFIPMQLASQEMVPNDSNKNTQRISTGDHLYQQFSSQCNNGLCSHMPTRILRGSQGGERTDLTAFFRCEYKYGAYVPNEYINLDTFEMQVERQSRNHPSEFRMDFKQRVYECVEVPDIGENEFDYMTFCRRFIVAVVKPVMLDLDDNIVWCAENPTPQLYLHWDSLPTLWNAFGTKTPKENPLGIFVRKIFIDINSIHIEVSHKEYAVILNRMRGQLPYNPIIADAKIPISLP